ncbi:MAG: ribosome maturation factor RimM [Clostridia bacterium]
MNDNLVIGEILKPQGVHGEVKVRPITCNPMRFADLTQALFEEGSGFVPVNLYCTRIDPDAVYLKIEGIKDRDDAEKVRGKFLYVDRAHAIRLPKDAEFICDLVGCRATDDEGVDYGTLTEVMQPGAGDVYVFKGPLGEVLVPALKRVILDVDVEKKKILLSAAQLKQVAVFEDD